MLGGQVSDERRRRADEAASRLRADAGRVRARAPVVAQLVVGDMSLAALVGAPCIWLGMPSSAAASAHTALFRHAAVDGALTFPGPAAVVVFVLSSSVLASARRSLTSTRPGHGA